VLFRSAGRVVPALAPVPALAGAGSSPGLIDMTGGPGPAFLDPYASDDPFSDDA